MSLSQNDARQQVPVVIVTYRDVYAWAARHDRNAEALYDKWAAIVRLSKNDISSLGISDGDRVKLSNSAGSVVVKAQLDKKCPHGFGFMPMSHIPNELTSYDSGKLPNFKWIETLAEAVSG
jgi:formylmethanofuran dehydrogenase subunit D